MYQRGRKRGVIVILGAMVPVIAIVAYLSTRPKKVTPPPKPEGDLLEKYKRERLVAKPCDETTTLDLVDYLMQHARWKDALDVAETSQVSCGEVAAIKDRILRCHQQLHQWAQAAALIEERLAEHPRASDLWWQHGETWRYRDQNELALVDFRQSLSNAYWARGGELAVRMIMYAAEAVKAPCEAARAWRYYQRQLGGRLDQEARDLMAALDRAKTCIPEDGTGKGRLVLGRRLRATIGTATAELLVDPRAGTTILSSELAERAGLVPTTAHRTATLWTDVRLSGQPARAPRMTVGNLAATNVDVVISDEIAAGDDGVIGLSFLWHFAVEHHGDDALVLSPPRP